MAYQKIKKESVLEASKFFITGNQNEKDRIVDKMLREQPAIMEYLEHLDKAVKNEQTKEVILQLMLIFYYAISIQEIKLTKIPFSDFLDSLAQSSEMKRYFHNPNHDFDRESFKQFFADYRQKEILNYTHFAVNEQFNDLIHNEQEALFIFYTLKILGDVIDQNIKN